MARGPAKRVAIDIGSSAIKLCEIAQSDTGFVLTKFARTDLRVDPSLPAEERDAIRLEGLREALGAVRNKYKKSVFAVPGQSVFVRNRELPSVPASKVADIVKYEITQQIPFPLRDIALDYHVLKRAETGEYDVMMVAIKVDAIDAYADVVQAAKLKIDTIDVGPIAAYNWMSYTGEFSDESETVACIDLGAATTDIFIVKDGYLRFTRSLTLAGNHLTDSIKTALKCSFLQAERIKIEAANVWPQIQRPVPQGLDPQFVEQSNDAMTQVLTRLVDEIRRSIAFFRSLPEGGPVTRVLITGGGAATSGLVQFLQDRLRINAVGIYNPLKGVQPGPGVEQAVESALTLTVPLGLAMRNHVAPAVEINLIPPRIIEAEKRKEKAVYWGLSFATMLMIAASVVPLKAQEFTRNQNESRRLTGEIAMYSARDAVKSQLETELNQLQAKCEKVAALQWERFTWLKPLLVVRQALPKGVWLQSLRCGYIGNQMPQPIVSSDDEEEGGDFSYGGGGSNAGLLFGFVDGMTFVPINWNPAGGAGMGMGMPGMGAPPGAAGAEIGLQGGQLPMVNCLELNGYANDFDTIAKLVDQVTDTFKKNGIFKELKFDPRQVVEMNRYTLQSLNAPQMNSGGYSSSDEDEEDGGYGGGGYGGGYGGGMMMRGGRPQSSVLTQNEGDTVWQFYMYVVMW